MSHCRLTTESDTAVLSPSSGWRSFAEYDAAGRVGEGISGSGGVVSGHWPQQQQGKQQQQQVAPGLTNDRCQSTNYS